MPTSETSPPVLVTGAAGKTGLAVCGALAQRGHAVRGLVRRPSQRAALEARGVRQVVEGDLTDAGDLARAARGARAIYHICPNVHPDEAAIGGHLIDAARSGGVRLLLYHSVLHPQIEAMPHHWAKLRVEESLLASGLDFCILRPAPYMQNLLGQWTSIAERGVLALPFALDTRIAMVDLEDVAEAAARVLDSPEHVGAAYDLCGPDLPDQREVAAILGEALGREVRAEVLPRAAWSRRAAESGMPRYAIDTLLAMFRYYERCGLPGSPATLEWLLGRPPTGLRSFAQRAATAS